MRTRPLLLIAASLLAIVVADQATKYLAVAHLTRALEAKTTFIERVADFYRVQHPAGDDAAGQLDLRRPPVVVVPNYWTHRYVENPGAAWGLLGRVPAGVRLPFFFAATLGAVVLIALFLKRTGGRQRLLSGALVLVLGGAIGNFVDRLARGYVIDFIDWHWRNNPDLHWPTFNLADAAISAGVVLMLIETLRPRRESADGADADRVSLPGREAEPS